MTKRKILVADLLCDTGGSHEAMAELNRACDEAMLEISG